MADRRQAGAIDLAEARGARLVVVEARYYGDIADALIEGVRRRCEAAGVTFDVITVPGALEVPVALSLVWHRYDGAVALGCVIRGETGHYDIVAGESARALMDFAVANRLPFGNGILTVETMEQAAVRADPDGMDKGGGAAEAALALVALARRAKRS